MRDELLVGNYAQTLMALVRLGLITEEEADEQLDHFTKVVDRELEDYRWWHELSKIAWSLQQSRWSRLTEWLTQRSFYWRLDWIEEKRGS